MKCANDRLIELCQKVDAVNSRLTFKQLRALLLLEKAGEDGMIKTQLAKAVGLSPGGISKACDTLGSRGRIQNSLYGTRNLAHTMHWIREEKHPTDGKAVLCFLTPQGRKYINELSELFQPEAINA